MWKSRVLPACAVLALILLVAPTGALAGETKGKFRFSFQVSGYLIADDIRSNADNVTTSRDQGSGAQVFTADPRPDRAAEKGARIRDADALGINMAYGVAGWKWGELLIESNYNYFESKVDDLEITGTFFLNDPTSPFPVANIVIPWKTFRTEVGNIRWHNPQLGALVRFRPAKGVVPYLGAGVGYYFVGFNESKQLKEFSKNLTSTFGSYNVYNPSNFKVGLVPEHRLGGIEVELNDDYEYHLVAGVEFNLKDKFRKWSFFVDTRYLFSDGRVRITADGREQLGQPVPDGSFPKFQPVGYAVNVASGKGGITDIGSAIFNFNTLELDKGPRDGILDPGQFYVEGGQIKYGGWLVSTGVRYTF